MPSPPLSPTPEADADPLAPLVAEIERLAAADTITRAAQVELVFLDVDGVMTDGRLDQGDDGVERKRFHARDTIGARLLVRAGVRLAIVSGRTSETLARRARELGVDELHQGVEAKLGIVERIAADAGMPLARCAYLGDDVVDLAPMRRVGLAICPADAHLVVRAQATHVLSRGGGAAALREAAELILHARGTLRDAHVPYLV